MNDTTFALDVQNICTLSPSDLEIEIDQDCETDVYRIWNGMIRIGHIHPTKSGKYFVADPLNPTN